MATIFYESDVDAQLLHGRKVAVLGYGSQDAEKAMVEILGEIQDGSFAREWIDEYESGQPNFQRLRDEGKTSQIESVGKQLRSMMSWIDTPTEADDPVT